jgi:membrane associated rhomboid family serine protease
MKLSKNICAKYPISIILVVIYVSIFIFLAINNLVQDVFMEPRVAQFTLVYNSSTINLVRYFTWIFIHSGLDNYIVGFTALVAVSFVLEEKIKSKKYLKVFILALLILNVLSVMNQIISIQISFFGFSSIYYILLGALLRQSFFNSKENRFLETTSIILNILVLSYFFIYQQRFLLNFDVFIFIGPLALLIIGSILVNKFYQYEIPEYQKIDLD